MQYIEDLKKIKKALDLIVAENTRVSLDKSRDAVEQSRLAVAGLDGHALTPYTSLIIAHCFLAKSIELNDKC